MIHIAFFAEVHTICGRLRNEDLPVVVVRGDLGALAECGLKELTNCPDCMEALTLE